MITVTKSENQQVINEFFEGYGHETAKEYGQTFFDVMQVLQTGERMTSEGMEDLTGKFSILQTLINEIQPGARL